MPIIELVAHWHHWGCSSTSGGLNPRRKWPFQVPKLEVPTIYKAYVRILEFPLTIVILINKPNCSSVVFIPAKKEQQKTESLKASVTSVQQVLERSDHVSSRAAAQVEAPGGEKSQNDLIRFDPTDWLIWLIDWLIDWFFDWLIDENKNYIAYVEIHWCSVCLLFLPSICAASHG